MRSICSFPALAAGAAACVFISTTALAQYQILSNIPGTYLDITATGTYYNLGDDGTADITSAVGNGLFPAGSHRISNNGAVAWGSTGATAFTNATIPSGSLGGGGLALAPYWDDLYTWASPQGVYVLEQAGTLYITWHVGHINNSSGTGIVQLQVHSAGNSLAQFIYQDVGSYGTGLNFGASATVGFQTSASSGIQYSFNTPGAVANGTVLSIVPISNDPGACCLTNGTCTFVSQINCQGAGGTFTTIGTTCAAANCPTPRACCFFDGTCSVLVPSACSLQGGASLSAGACSAGLCPAPWAEQGDAGNLPASAQATVQSGPTSTLVGLMGFLEGQGAVDMYKVRICDFASFSATTVNGAMFDTQLFVFRENGQGAIGNDDAPGQFVSSTVNNSTGCLTANGTYYVAISAYNNDPVSPGGLIFPDSPYTSVFCATGPGGSQPVSNWNATSIIVGGFYSIRMNGACYAEGAPVCYANCDESTAAPVLNVQDFTCFLQRYAAGESYANCDGSTQAPTLNVQDFTCFLQTYAVGCP
jgi:hypothetical protein